MKVVGEVTFKWKPGAKQKIKANPDVITYTCARKLLDMAVPLIPMDTGKMRKTSVGNGVRGGGGNYYIGSYTSYAKEVWNKPKNTNWTTTGTTSKWYEVAMRKYGKLILAQAVNEKGFKR